MEMSLVYNRCVTLPDGYEVQLMVMRDFAGGWAGSGRRGMVYRARVWIGTTWEREPLLYRSQEHGSPGAAVDACYRMLAASAPRVVESVAAREAARRLTDGHFAAAAG